MVRRYRVFAESGLTQRISSNLENILSIPERVVASVIRIVVSLGMSFFFPITISTDDHNS